MNSKTEAFFRKKSVICIFALICTALWGSAFPCVKTGYSLFAIDSADTASVILFAGIRFAGAGILTIILTGISSKKLLLPRKTSWGRILILCMFQTVIQYLFFYISLAHTTGVKGSILEGSGTLFSILFACVLFRQEKFTASKALGCAAGFIGMVVVNLTGGAMSFEFTLVGEGFMIISAVSYGFSCIFTNRFAAKDNPVMLSGYQFLIGGLILAIAGFALGGRLGSITLSGIVLLIYMMFISAAAYSLWSILLKYNPVSRITIYGFMIQVFGAFFSALFLNEAGSIGINTVIALVLVCLGIYLVNSDTRLIKK